MVVRKGGRQLTSRSEKKKKGLVKEKNNGGVPMKSLRVPRPVGFGFLIISGLKK